MQEKRKALGRGLEELFNNEPFSMNDFERNIVEETKAEDVKEIEISELRSNPYQPRKVFDEEKIDELAKSIKDYGLIEPIIVKKSIKGYEIVAGERRTLAAKKAGLTTIKAIVKDFTDEDMMSIALLENIQREDLNVIEEANAYKKMLDVLRITQEELAEKIGKSRSHVTNILGLLKLPKKVQDMVLTEKITMGHARCLSKLSDEKVIYDLAQMIVLKDLSVREVEELISASDYKKNAPIKKTKEVDESHMHLQSILREKIGTLVKVNKKNLVIPFENDKDLERILEILNIDADID